MYSGDKLPRWYFGSGTIDKIENKSYRGSVSSKVYKSMWVSELENNPHLFKTRILRRFYSRKMASVAEYHYQKKYNMIKDTTFINKSHAIKWYNMSINFTQEHRRKLSESHKAQVHCININGDIITVSKETFYNDSSLTSISKGRVVSEDTKDKISKSNKGIRKSETHCSNISKSMKGVAKSDEHKDRISKSLKGRKYNHSQETRDKMSAERKSRKYPKVLCPYCSRLVPINNKNRWHFDNCKLKVSDSSI